MNTVRATFSLNPLILRKFKQFAKDTDKSLSSLVEQGITKVMDDVEQVDCETQYNALMKMAGVDTTVNPDLDNLSVDEVLYGDNDGWRGRND